MLISTLSNRGKKNKAGFMVTPRMAYVSRIIRQNAAKLSNVKQKSPLEGQQTLKI